MTRFCVALALVAGVLANFAACGSDAVGVDECRSIEQARCAAATHCKFGITTAGLESECALFARDNCLHGLKAAPPTAAIVDKCVQAIQSAGTCARKQGTGTLGTDCGALADSVSSPKTTVCDIIESPEETAECAFLTNVPPPAKRAATDAGSD